MHRAKAFSSKAWLNSADHGLVEELGKASFMSGVKANSSKAHRVPDNSGWEILSVEEALSSLEQMPQLPSIDSFTCILHKCREDQNLEHIKRLHAYMCKSGLEGHSCIGNYLIPMLVQVGSIGDAQQVFNRLVNRNVYSWTSLIIGYVKGGEAQHALNLYQKLHEDCVSPSKYTFVALLKACARLENVERGHEIHAEIARKGLERDLYIGSTFVDMYAKSGSIVKAQEVFEKLPVRDVVSWTALISGFAEQGFGEEALNCFEQMQLEDVSPNAFTFRCSLKACGSIGGRDKGREIHVAIARNGMEGDPLIGRTLVDMYSKCGSLTKARELFEKLPVRDVVAWNILIAGYAEYNLAKKALDCFEHMQWEGVSPDAVSFVCSLKACGNIGAIDKGQEIHAEIARKGLEIDVFVGSTLVDMYAKCGSPAKACEVFDKLPSRDVVTWNIVIAAYAEYGLGDKALRCVKQMQLEGVSLNTETFICSLKACGSIGAIDKGEEIHAEIVKSGLERDLVVGSALIDMYAKCGSLAKALEAFCKLSARNEVSWNILIAGYAEHGLGEEALKCFERMQLEGVSPNALTFVWSLKACGSMGAIDKGLEIQAEITRKGLERDPFVGSALVNMYVKCGLLVKAHEVFDMLPIQDVVLWNTLIAGYVEHGLGEKALNCFDEMHLEGIFPDAVTFVCSLKACGSIGAVDKGQEIHADIAKMELERDLFVGSAVVDMYAKCGSLAKAQEVFDRLPVHDEVSWTSLIAAYAQRGESEIVFHMLERMIKEGIKPGGVTFLRILTACSHTGLVDKGQKYFEAMSKDYGITPNIEHYTCMVDLLGRSGQLKEAVEMVKKMPFHPNLVVWHTILGACRRWGNVEVGRRAFEHAVQLDEKDAAAYVLMSNIYGDAHMQEDKKKVEVMRMKKQAWKIPIQTSIDIHGLLRSYNAFKTNINMQS